MDTSDIRDYEIHQERIVLDAELFAKVAQLHSDRKHIIAVGTTVARTLETLPYVWLSLSSDEHRSYDSQTQDYRHTLTATIDQKYIGEYIASCTRIDDIYLVATSIFIYPGFVWRVVDMLITNFHIP